jgi:hypothetical protein
MKEYRIVGKEIFFENGSFKKVREWIDGWHDDPDLGIRTFGWNGEKQTMRERDFVVPESIFEVK